MPEKKAPGGEKNRTMKRIDRLKRLIRVARGEQPPDLVLKGGRVLNLFTGEIIRADVAISAVGSPASAATTARR